jgi:acyl-CoA thioester hydrolase
MSRADLPPFSQVVALPGQVTGSVGDSFIDDNGHMNVRRYLDQAVHGASTWADSVGIDPSYRADRRMGIFTTTHHLDYHSELHLGWEFSVHVVLADRAAKAVHLIAMITDVTNERLASTVETLLVHVDLDTRRPVSIPEDIDARLNAELAATRSLPWQLPLSGAVAIRR